MITFTDTLPKPEDYWDLFQTTGWNDEYNFTPKELGNAIKNSWYSNSVYDSGKLIGFGRVISDGVHHALIVDLIIHPDYQGRGFGRKLLDRLGNKCKEVNIRDIQLFAARNKSEFYEKAGFEKRPVDAPGMQMKKE
jgi:N-acetylglutamate synthase-like GNAT family acetyltransferase